ncbi:Na+/H+-dicarboxylate symporter [Ruminococcaceae bacterium YRB3002]|nr:Na+/H+-dicarboxylate symporter [Ruminococcaceae bacterium YRB3002]
MSAAFLFGGGPLKKGTLLMYNMNMKKARIMNRRIHVDGGDKAGLQSCLDFIETSLTELGVDRKLVIRSILIAEETIPLMVEHNSEGTDIRVRIRKVIGDTVVTISARGEEFDPMSGGVGADGNLSDLEDENVQAAIRSILLMSQADLVKSSHRNGVNTLQITACQSEKSMFAYTIAALILGLIAGLLLRFVLPDAVADGISSYVLTPVKTIFMNALKIIIAPVIFFSIVTCISQFKNISELGRIGAKTMGMYFLTTAIAIALALGFYTVIKPGQTGFALASENAATVAATEETASGTQEAGASIINTLVDIVPDNFIKPFLESNTLQLIFLAVLVGVAVGMVGEHSTMLRDIADAFYSLALTITRLISKLIPLAVFCSVSTMLLSLGGKSFFNVLGLFGTHVLTILGILVVYGILILVMAHLNPLKFYRKNRDGMMTAFTLGSSAACIPTNMKICTEKMGISHKVCNFSIPLGATVNMDGGSIFLILTGLFLANAYDVSVTGSMLASLILTVVMLSIGTPGVPGAGLVAIGIVASSLGLPVESVGLIIGIYPIIDMFNTMSNTTGDVAASLVVAKNEGLVDKEMWK